MGNISPIERLSILLRITRTLFHDRIGITQVFSNYFVVDMGGVFGNNSFYIFKLNIGTIKAKEKV